MQKSAVAFGVKQKRIGEGMENKEFEKQVKDATTLYVEFTVILSGGGGIYADSYSFWSNEIINAVDLFKSGQCIARIPLKSIKKVY